MKILLLPGSRNSPAARCRIWQFVPHLRNAGHEVAVRIIYPERHWKSPLPGRLLRTLHTRLASLVRVLSALWITRDIESFDVVMMNKDLFPEQKIRWMEPWLSRRNPRLIFDFDDAVYLGSRGKKLEKILPSFSRIFAGNPTLADYAKSVFKGPVDIVPTVVDTEKLVPSPRRPEGPVRVGWSGSSATLRYSLPLLEKVITELSRTESFEFVVIAEVEPQIRWPGVRMRYIPWTEESEVRGLQHIDIGLMPLKDDAFERGKCGLKALQYMAVGAPALVSPVGVNEQIVRHGIHGYHCRTDDEWLECLRRLLDDKELRGRLGSAARKRAEEEYSVQVWAPRIVQIFEKIRSEK